MANYLLCVDFSDIHTYLFTCIFHSHTLTQTHTALQREHLAPIHNLTCGVMAGVLASLITQPADVVKTRMQINPSQYPTLLSTLAYTLRERGPQGLFTGSMPRAARRTFMAAFTWLFYEEVCCINNYICPVVSRNTLIGTIYSKYFLIVEDSSVIWDALSSPEDVSRQRDSTVNIWNSRIMLLVLSVLSAFGSRLFCLKQECCINLLVKPDLHILPIGYFSCQSSSVVLHVDRKCLHTMVDLTLLPLICSQTHLRKPRKVI